VGARQIRHVDAQPLGERDRGPARSLFARILPGRADDPRRDLFRVSISGWYPPMGWISCATNSSKCVPPIDLELVGSKTTGTGVVIATYRTAKSG
jgi:hypothetical protein